MYYDLCAGIIYQPKKEISERLNVPVYKGLIGVLAVELRAAFFFELLYRSASVKKVVITFPKPAFGGHSGI